MVRRSGVPVNMVIIEIVSLQNSFCCKGNKIYLLIGKYVTDNYHMYPKYWDTLSTYQFKIVHSTTVLSTSFRKSFFAWRFTQSEEVNLQAFVII